MKYMLVVIITMGAMGHDPKTIEMRIPQENKEECFELTEAMNWTSTFGEDDYMANIEWKHEDDGSSSKWMWDDITFMVISEVEGNWQISWWLLG